MLAQPSLLSDLALLALLLGGASLASLSVLLIARALPLDRALAPLHTLRAPRAELATGLLSVAFITTAALSAMGLTPWASGPSPALVGLATFAGFVLASSATISRRAESASLAAQPSDQNAASPADAKAA